jgi:UDP-N-acetyl-D-glucosamine dehydrogenase
MTSTGVHESGEHSPSAHSNGRLSATNDYDVLKDVDVVIICVPTPLSKARDPDLSHIIAATDAISKRLHKGMLVVLESTTYPGSTEELILPRLLAQAPPNFEVGSDFYLAFSPERIDPGQTRWTIFNTPKIIGGMTQCCAEVSNALYGSVVQQTVPVSSPRTAEMVKLLENTFRATNIAMVNEVAIICDRLGVDVWEVIEAASTKPFGFMPFQPGPGLGGHCLPIDPQYLAWKLKSLDYTARFVNLADEVNRSMPSYWVNKVQDALNQTGKPMKGSNVLVLGVTYKRDTDDIRESPALDIMDRLFEKGADLTFHDAYVRSVETDTFGLVSISDGDLAQGLTDADCVVIVADHTYYDWQRVREKATLIVDTRNALGDSLPKPAASLHDETLACGQ